MTNSDRYREFANICITCEVEGGCHYADPKCRHPKDKYGKPIELPYLTQHSCGVPERAERGVTCR